MGAALLCSRGAVAAPPPPPPPAEAPSTPLVAPSRGGLAAEQRMKSGDCAGALDEFDAALRTSTDPKLLRDRGACHEKLGHPYPAIDDYRAYLTARPNAADADAIRARLDALEQQVGEVKNAPGEGGKRKSTGADLEIEVSTAGEAEVASSAGSSSTKTGLDALEKDEALSQQADASPLRKGTGLVLGVSVDPAVFGKSELGWSETAGVDLRYAFTRVSTVLVQFNFQHVNSTGTASSLGGAGVVGGYEARFALNPRVNDALLVGGLFGYEHLSQGATGLVYGVITPKARIGWRHVFGPSFGFEATLDGGLAFLHLTGDTGISGSDTTTALVGGHFAFVLGF
jgi:hypothetical protein